EGAPNPVRVDGWRSPLGRSFDARTGRVSTRTHPNRHTPDDATAYTLIDVAVPKLSAARFTRTNVAGLSTANTVAPSATFCCRICVQFVESKLPSIRASQLVNVPPTPFTCSAYW